MDAKEGKPVKSPKSSPEKLMTRDRRLSRLYGYSANSPLVQTRLKAPKTPLSPVFNPDSTGPVTPDNPPSPTHARRRSSLAPIPLQTPKTPKSPGNKNNNGGAFFGGSNGHNNKTAPPLTTLKRKQTALYKRADYVDDSKKSNKKETRGRSGSSFGSCNDADNVERDGLEMDGSWTSSPSKYEVIGGGGGGGGDGKSSSKKKKSSITFAVTEPIVNVGGSFGNPAIDDDEEDLDEIMKWPTSSVGDGASSSGSKTSSRNLRNLFVSTSPHHPHHRGGGMQHSASDPGLQKKKPELRKDGLPSWYCGYNNNPQSLRLSPMKIRSRYGTFGASKIVKKVESMDQTIRNWQNHGYTPPLFGNPMNWPNDASYVSGSPLKETIPPEAPVSCVFMKRHSRS